MPCYHETNGETIQRLHGDLNQLTRMLCDVCHELVINDTTGIVHRVEGLQEWFTKHSAADAARREREQK